MVSTGADAGVAVRVAVAVTVAAATGTGSAIETVTVSVTVMSAVSVREIVPVISVGGSGVAVSVAVISLVAAGEIRPRIPTRGAASVAVADVSAVGVASMAGDVAAAPVSVVMNSRATQPVPTPSTSTCSHSPSSLVAKIVTAVCGSSLATIAAPASGALRRFRRLSSVFTIPVTGSVCASSGNAWMPTPTTKLHNTARLSNCIHVRRRAVGNGIIHHSLNPALGNPAIPPKPAGRYRLPSRCRLGSQHTRPSRQALNGYTSMSSHVV